MKRFMRRFSKVGWASRPPRSWVPGSDLWMCWDEAVYATVLEGWLGIPSASILGAGFRPLDVLG